MFNHIRDIFETYSLCTQHVCIIIRNGEHAYTHMHIQIDTYTHTHTKTHTHTHEQSEPLGIHTPTLSLCSQIAFFLYTEMRE